MPGTVRISGLAQATYRSAWAELPSLALGSPSSEHPIVEQCSDPARRVIYAPKVTVCIGKLRLRDPGVHSNAVCRSFPGRTA
jgi:hypothetical protein